MSHKTFDPHGTSDAARQGLLDNRCEHGPKRHRMRKRSKALGAKKRAACAHKIAVNNAKRRRRLEASRAYWRGEKDSHP